MRNPLLLSSNMAVSMLPFAIMSQLEIYWFLTQSILFKLKLAHQHLQYLIMTLFVNLEHCYKVHAMNLNTKVLSSLRSLP